MQVRPIVFIVLVSLLALLFGCSREPATAPTDETSPATEERTDTPIETSQPSVAEEETVGGEASRGELVATINGRPVDREELDGAKDEVLAQYRQIYAQFGMDISTMLVGAAGRLFKLGLESNALDQLVFTALIDEEAERRGISVTEDEIETEFTRQYAALLESQGMTEEMLATYLESQGQDLTEFKQDGRRSIEEQLQFNAVQRAVSEPIELSEDDLRAYFDEHRTDYATEEQVRASHILVETEVEALRLHEELDAGAEFAELAREHSIDTGSAAQGGDLGWFGRGRTVAPFEEAAFALQIGEISDVVETDYGYHILLLTGYKEATQPEFGEVTDRVHEDAEGEILDERFRGWYETVYAAAMVIVEDPLLAAFRTQQEDVDLGLAAFERLKAEGSVDEPYLPYLIGSLYETKRNAAIADKEGLEATDSEDPDIAVQIAALEEEIETLRQKALAAYREQLEILGGSNTEIETRIDALTSSRENGAGSE